MEKASVDVEKLRIILLAAAKKSELVEIQAAIGEGISILDSAPAKKLWRAPSYYITILLVVIVLIFASLWKVCFSGIWIPLKMALKLSEKTYDLIDVIIFIFWLIGPPCFFLFEYTYIFGKDESNRLDPEQCADIKTCQELASKIWAAVGLLFSVILALKYGIK